MVGSGVLHLGCNPLQAWPMWGRGDSVGALNVRKEILEGIQWALEQENPPNSQELSLRVVKTSSPGRKSGGDRER